MQLIINITEHEKSVIDRYVDGHGYSYKDLTRTTVIESLAQAVHKGIVLPKGHWIYQTSDDYLGELNRYYECSECGRTVGDTVGDIYTEYPYCHCGAKMIKDGEK